jgi:hypothetical protein
MSKHKSWDTHGCGCGGFVVVVVVVDVCGGNNNWAMATESYPFPQVASMAVSTYGRSTDAHKACANATLEIAGWYLYRVANGKAYCGVVVVVGDDDDDDVGD